jgi:hypothetical protein
LTGDLSTHLRQFHSPIQIGLFHIRGLPSGIRQSLLHAPNLVECGTAFDAWIQRVNRPFDAIGMDLQSLIQN